MEPDEKPSFSFNKIATLSKLKHHYPDFVADKELGRRVDHFYSSSSEDSVVIPSASLPLISLSRLGLRVTSCFRVPKSLPSSPICKEDEQLMTKLRSSEVIEQENAVILLRKLTRMKEELRVLLYTPQFLSAVRSLIISRYSTIEAQQGEDRMVRIRHGSVLALYHLTLVESNRVKLVKQPNAISTLLTLSKSLASTS
ncbi:hypothetical protein GBA52_015094 [Prunus armeniaca]|nr:hypothetical protein GBA52_015094 [Prunus armeniaca]